MAVVIVKPRLLPRDFRDFATGTSVAGLILLLTFAVPAVVVFMVTGSRLIKGPHPGTR